MGLRRRLMNDRALGASFRDPSGYLFERDGVLLRSVHRAYAPHYDLLMSSGLYAELVERGQLIPHEEIPADEHAWRYVVLDDNRQAGAAAERWQAASVAAPA